MIMNCENCAAENTAMRGNKRVCLACRKIHNDKNNELRKFKNAQHD